MKNKYPSLSDKITEKLREQIIYGSWEPGKIITVREIAQKYNVSTTPVRDAVNRLVQSGLLNNIPYKGYIVSHINIKELDDLFTIRILLEAAAIEMLINNITPEQLKILEKLAPKKLTFSEDDKISFMKTNHKFHVELAKSTGNKYLEQIINDILEKMQRILYIDLKHIDLTSMQMEHLQLINFIKEGDAEKAKKLIIFHIEESRNRVFGRGRN